jgi:hypothetical protein
MPCEGTEACAAGAPCALEDDFDAGPRPEDAGAVAADAGAPPKPRPTCTNVDQRLLGDFGIVIKPGTLPFEGLAPETIACEKKILVYEMFIPPFQFEKFSQRLQPSDPFTIHLYRGSAPVLGSCSGYTPNPHAIQVRDLKQCLAAVSDAADPDFRRVATFLNHESGHVMSQRNPALKTQFNSANLVQLDAKCYDRGFLKTYSLRTTNPVSESFSEALALFVWRKKVGRYGTINDFKTECPHTYEWIRTTVFGAHL